MQHLEKAMMKLMMKPMMKPSDSYLPPSDSQRLVLHNEIHTRPSATFKLPALVVYVAVLNAEVSISDECQHLR